LNCSVPIDVVVKGWNAIEVVFDAPKNAVPVGTVAGVQLAAVLKSPELGLAFHVASCARAGNAASNATAAVVVSKCARIAPPPLRNAQWAIRSRSRKPRRDWRARRSRIIAVCPHQAKTPTHASRRERKLGHAPTSGRNLMRVAETPQSSASFPRTASEGADQVRRARAKRLRPKIYFLPLSALNISKPSAGLRFLCTTACTALIIACGASDWKMLRPMSTPAAPCWTAL